MIFDAFGPAMFRLFFSLVGLLWAQAPRLVVAPSEYRFGVVSRGTVVRATYKLYNVGEGILQIQEIKPSCSCSVLEWERRDLKPGDSLQIQVSFNTAGKIGPQRKTFTVLSNASNSPTFFYMQGEVQASSVYAPADED